MKALIFIDMQEDFCDYGPFTNIGVLEIDAKIPNFIKKLNHDNSWKIIFSIDYHPFNHESFKIFPRHCIKGTLGAEFLPNSMLVHKNLIIKKGTKRSIDNLSAFYNGNKKSPLDKFLKKNKIEEILLAGVIGDICVRQTYLDLLKEGYKVTIIDELTYFRVPESRKGLNILKIEEVL